MPTLPSVEHGVGISAAGGTSNISTMGASAASLSIVHVPDYRFLGYWNNTQEAFDEMVLVLVAASSLFQLVHWLLRRHLKRRYAPVGSRETTLPLATQLSKSMSWVDGAYGESFEDSAAELNTRRSGSSPELELEEGSGDVGSCR